MPIISKIDLYELGEQHSLSIREVIHFDSFAEIASRAFAQINDYAARQGLLFSGCPFVCYHNTDLSALDVEIGYPLATDIAGENEIQSVTIPPRRAVQGIFQGPYEESDPLMFEIIKWISTHGLTQQGPIYHYYLNNSEQKPSDLLTRIVIPVH